MGIMPVLTDPRSSMAQCLQAILTAELTDNAGSAHVVVREF